MVVNADALSAPKSTVMTWSIQGTVASLAVSNLI